MKKLIIALSILLAVLLGVCALLHLHENNEGSGTQPNQTESEQQTQPTETVTLTFRVDEAVYREITLTACLYPEAFAVEMDGIRFVRWLDSNGNEVDPFAEQAARDTTYYAEVYPLLAGHVAFLFTDENNQLHPEEALIADDLAAALTVLAGEGAEDYYPELPAGETEVSFDELTDLLKCFFEEEKIVAAFGDGDGDVSRAAFAVGMTELLGYSADEKITLAPGTIIPVDVTGDRADAIALLQASTNSTPDDTAEQTWADVELPVAYEPGFVNIDGWLYYVDDNHYFLKNDSLGTLNFGADGRYTCGDATLDATVAQLLKGFMEANPEMTRLEILREAYDYCHENFGYRRTYDHPAFGETGWEIQRANAMFEKGKGNCYSFAAIFWALSRGLGYEARAMSGTCLKDEQPHSWCIIEIDGADYFFDPEWQYAYHERGVYDKDMFMIPMDKVSYWTYKWVEE